MSDFQVYEQHKAKVEHKCNMCGAIIPVGSIYQINKGVYDGYLFESKECLACQPVISEFLQSDWGDYGYCDDWMHEWWMDEKCPKCKNYYNPCDWEDSCCNFIDTNGNCEFMTKDRKCRDEPCNNMTHYCRCENFELIKKE